MGELIIAVISFIGGWLAGRVLDYSLDKAVDTIALHKRRKKIKDVKDHANTDIQVLCSGVPCFTPENIYAEVDQATGLFLAFPEELAAQLPKSVGTFKTKDELFAPLTLPGCDEETVHTAVEEARYKIARMFIERQDGLFFNGKKYGIVYADGFSRTTDNTENPILTLKLFNTDHYTHRVLSEVIDNLQIDKTLLNQKMLNTRLNWLRTSFGISAIVVLRSTDQIIMTRRSPNAAYTEGKIWTYVSVTETFTETDYDQYSHCADLALCMKRGIQEELGITPGMYHESTIKFYDTFYETHFFQDGIVGSVELKEGILFEDVKNLLAKDKQLEVESLFVIDNNKKAIAKFIAENKDQMRSQTIFALNSYAARLRQ